ncbi:MAG: DMT family transporter [Pirellulaceae bacterium]|nr:DMT family transporter [Pirellulaceae bacterium]
MSPYLWMLIGSVFFAVMSLLTESLGTEYSFAWIAGVRSAIATLLAVIMVWLGGAKLVFFRPLSLWWRSLAGSSSMMFLFFAMTHYDVSIILSLSSMYPIWVAVLAWPLLGQLPSRDTWYALAVSTLGMWMVYQSANGAESSGQFHANYLPQWAIPAGVIAGLLSGVALLGLHRVKEVDTRAVVAHFSAVSTVVAFLVYAVLPPHISTSVDHSSVFRLVAVGVTALIGQLFLTRAFAAGRPARVSVVGLSQVAIAAIYKWILEGKAPTPLSLLGLILVLGSTLWVMLRDDKAI